VFRYVTLSLLTLLLFSCANTQWVKSGATPEDFDADTVACNNQILTSSIGARGMLGMGAPTPRGRAEASSRARAGADLELTKCLQEKGWTQQKVE